MASLLSSPEEYAMQDYKNAVEHINHAKGLVLNESIQRQLFGLWIYISQKSQPTIKVLKGKDKESKELQLQVWIETAKLYDSKIKAMADYVNIVTRNDPDWRRTEQKNEPVPEHIKSQLKNSGINIVDSSSDNNSESDDSLSDSDQDEEALSHSKTKSVVAKKKVIQSVTSIFQAARIGSSRISMFLPTGANDIDHQTGVSVLMTAVDAEQEEMVNCLLTHGAEVNWIDPQDGSTALHCATLLGSTKICLLLIKFGGKLDIKDNDGMTPKDIALEEKHSDIALLMENVV